MYQATESSHAPTEAARATSAHGHEVALTDEDFEHAKSVRLLLDFLVHGVVGHSPEVPVEDIADVIDLANKYHCRSGYEFCIAYTAFVLTRDMTYATAGDVLILASQLNETRLAKPVVGLLAERQKQQGHPILGSVLESWGPFHLTQSPTYLWALRKALAKTLHGSVLVLPSRNEAERQFERMVNVEGVILATWLDANSSPGPLTTPKLFRGTERRAQQSWGAK